MTTITHRSSERRLSQASIMAEAAAHHARKVELGLVQIKKAKPGNNSVSGEISGEVLPDVVGGFVADLLADGRWRTVSEIWEAAERSGLRVSIGTVRRMLVIKAKAGLFEAETVSPYNLAIYRVASA